MGEQHLKRILPIAPFVARHAASTVVALVWVLGCGAADNCPDAKSRQFVESGRTDLVHLNYESAPWHGRFEAFPANTEVAFEHGLGVTPEIVVTYLSFKAKGISDDSSVAENAGNSATITCVDSEVVIVKNDTCEDGFFIRVVAQASGSGSADAHCVR